MLELRSGQVIIDEIDISTVPREEVRKRLNTIPQGAFSFSGTVRDNLDPWHFLDDERILSVLKKLNLQEWLDARGGLDEELEDESLSHGQKQIFSVARAILRPGRIVIMDEITSR
jgi:ABC-type multidrug transport system fused ATPase/permease subunit